MYYYQLVQGSNDVIIVKKSHYNFHCNDFSYYIDEYHHIHDEGEADANVLQRKMGSPKSPDRTAATAAKESRQPASQRNIPTLHANYMRFCIL